MLAATKGAAVIDLNDARLRDCGQSIRIESVAYRDRRRVSAAMPGHRANQQEPTEGAAMPHFDDAESEKGEVL